MTLRFRQAPPPHLSGARLDSWVQQQVANISPDAPASWPALEAGGQVSVDKKAVGQKVNLLSLQVDHQGEKDHVASAGTCTNTGGFAKAC